MKDKILDFFEKSLTSQEVLKRIAFYLLVMCVILIMIFFKLKEINQNILLVSGNYSNSVLIETKNENYDEVSDIFVSYPEEEQISDSVPLHKDITEASTKATTVQDNSNKETTTLNNLEETSSKLSGISVKINYVINVNSKKIHFADCTFVSRMKEENRQSVQLTKDELNEYINNGYTLCSTCGG